MGSATYEFILGVDSWPYEGLPTWVFTSRELPAMEGADIRFANGAVAPHHAEMAAAAGDRDVWLVGGGHLATQFADDGLLDELILTVVPVVLGSGLPDLRRAPRGAAHADRRAPVPERDGRAALRVPRSLARARGPSLRLPSYTR